VKKKLDELKRPDKNLRLHTEKQLIEFERSVKMFGQIRPIVIDEYGVMLAGNGLFETLQRLGHTEADCYVVEGLNEQQKKKLMLSDNRIFDLGVDDMATFDSFILELKNDLDVPGYDEDMLRSLVADAAEAVELLTGYGTVPPDRVDEIRETEERYKARDEAAARDAELRDATGVAEAYKAEVTEQKYILCPKCGERIWLETAGV
jgi:ParB-like chromosome segregation protein Spo0J